MPLKTDGVREGIALTLSGGGFRATLFHCGTLWRLNELGYLPKVEFFSSVSGGSITAGLLARKWTTLQFTNDVAANLLREVIDPLRDFCGRNVDAPSIARLATFRRVSTGVEKRYRKYLFGDTSLQNLPDTPIFAVNATNLSTGVCFTFSKSYAGDYRIGELKKPTYRLSVAVAASSAFAPYLSPVVIKADPNQFVKTRDFSDLFDQPPYKERITLTDGGVYDNLGLEPVWNDYKTILVSDAGMPFEAKSRPRTNWYSQATRAIDVTTNQTRALRKRILVDAYYERIRRGAYWGIMTDIEGQKIPGAFNVPAETTRELASMRTRLNRFSEEEQCRLINWGYAVCDARMRKYVLQDQPQVPPSGWPYKKYAL